MTPEARRFLLSLLAIAGLLLVRRRPVRGPDPTGDWHPAETK